MSGLGVGSDMLFSLVFVCITFIIGSFYFIRLCLVGIILPMVPSFGIGLLIGGLG